MQKIRSMISALAIGLLAALVAVHPALASSDAVTTPTTEQRYGFTCVDGVCRAQFDLGIGMDALPQGAWLTVVQSALNQLPGGAGIEVLDNVTLTLPTGNLTLADAELALTLDDAGKIATMRGSATVPVPTFGLLGEMQLVTPARISIGYDKGQALQPFDAPLVPDRRYFFIDAEAGLHLFTQEMALASDAGQRVTLIVNFAQPLIYLDGHVTLHTNGQMAFIREVLGPLGESDWLPNDLPLRQTMHVQLQGQAGRELDPELSLAGEFRVDSGMVGQWLQVNAMPLLVQGEATISPLGLMLEGTARSALQPERWFDGGALAQIFVPFDALDATSMTVAADIALPALQVDETVATTMAGTPGWIQHAGESVWAGVQHGWTQVGSVVQNSYGWLEDGAGTGLAYTQRQWCALSGLCETDKAAEEGVPRVAAAQ